MIWNGASTPILIEQREDFTPEQGFVTVTRWAGTDAQLRALQQAEAVAGRITRWVKRGGH
jgi:hypothetical protein